LSISSIARAATFVDTTVGKDGKVTTTLSGEIIEGDSDYFKRIIQLANNNSHMVAILRLDSPGGSILEGVKLADIVRFGKIATSVVGNSKCASACFIVFAAGNEKCRHFG